jgi:hypothetical protein
VEKLQEAFRSLRKDASAGIDGVTYQQYVANADGNIRQLHQRLKDGKYQAQPLRRVYIPKEDGKRRPISIPALEDKLVQKVAVDLLNAIYEQDFLDCSCGFRPGRGQHQTGPKLETADTAKESLQFTGTPLLGQTTERDLGTGQDLSVAVNDALGLEMD